MNITSCYEFTMADDIEETKPDSRQSLEHEDDSVSIHTLVDASITYAPLGPSDISRESNSSAVNN